MLSSVGTQTRPNVADQPVPDRAPVREAAPGPAQASAPEPAPAPTPPQPPVLTAAPPARVDPEPDTNDPAPRTVRLRAATATRLRAAWLEAKRDDVLLTAQDFGSNLLDEALAARQRRPKSGRSG